MALRDGRVVEDAPAARLDAAPLEQIYERGTAARCAVTRPAPAADAEWDAGDLGCGELVLELVLRMRRLAPGQVLRLVARDPGAPADMPGVVPDDRPHAARGSSLPSTSSAERRR